jgi:hypothetical protein
MKRFLFIALGLVLISASLAGCYTQKTVLKDQDPVPPEFGKAPGTVLVLKAPTNQLTNALEKTFQKYYSGPYELVDESLLTSKRYSDTQKYRYVFRTKMQFVPGYGTGDGKIASSYNYSYDVLDRVTNKTNGLTFYGGAYKGLMEAYVKKLDEVKKAG